MNELTGMIEALLMAAKEPLTVKEIERIIERERKVKRQEIVQSLQVLQTLYFGRGVELVEVSSGWRMQIPSRFSSMIGALYQEKPERYSRALFETLALIAYEQPITRGEIEAVRGVTVGSNIMRILEEREWVEVLGRKEVAGRPNLYGTTAQFLDDFGLKSLDELPEIEGLSRLMAEHFEEEV